MLPEAYISYKNNIFERIAGWAETWFQHDGLEVLKTKPPNQNARAVIDANCFNM